MSELKNVNDSHHDNDNDEDIPMTYHIFEVIDNCPRVYHQGVHIPSHIKGKEAIEAYMKEAEKASDAGVKWSDNPYTTLWEYVLNYIEPVDYLPSTSSVRYLRTDDQ
jgi:hypothetical protein